MTNVHADINMANNRLQVEHKPGAAVIHPPACIPPLPTALSLVSAFGQTEAWVEVELESRLAAQHPFVLSTQL